MKYFANISTLDDLKREYRRLVMIHHPDRGGDTATMQAINKWYWRHAEDGACRYRGKSTMATIRAKYGSQRIGGAGEVLEIAAC